MVGGAVIAKDKALHQDLAWWANCLGITGAPFDRFLTLRGIRTLQAHPATMTHAAMDPDARRQAGIGDTLIRLSVGIESSADLVNDLECGLDQVAQSLEQSLALSC